MRNRMRRLFDNDLVQVVTVVRPLTTRATVIAMCHLKVVGDPDGIADKLADWPEATFVALTGGNSNLMVELVADRAVIYELWRKMHTLEGVASLEMNTYLKVAKQLYAGPHHA